MRPRHERRREHADDFERPAIEHQAVPSTDGFAEPAPPEPVCEIATAVWPPGRSSSGGNCGPGWAPSRARKEIRGHRVGAHDFRITVGRQREPGAGVCRHPLEAAALIPPVEKRRVRNRKRGPSFFRIAFPEAHEPIRFGERQRPQHHGVDDGEDRGVRAHAERERDRSDGGESRASAERARAVPHVLPERFGPASPCRSAEHRRFSIDLS